MGVWIVLVVQIAKCTKHFVRGQSIFFQAKSITSPCFVINSRRSVVDFARWNIFNANGIRTK